MGAYFTTAHIFPQEGVCDYCGRQGLIKMQQGAWPNIRFACVDSIACWRRTHADPSNFEQVWDALADT